MKLKQIINPIIVIGLSTALFLFFLNREKEMKESHIYEINKKQQQIDQLSSDWILYKQDKENQINVLMDQIERLKKQNHQLELKKQDIKTVYYEKYIEINDYNIGNVVQEFDSIFSANNIK